jgi:hypothetical protein
LGDAGIQAIIEFVGVRDRETVRSEKPSFGDDTAADAEDQNDEVAAESEEEVTDESSEPETAADDASEEKSQD